MRRCRDDCAFSGLVWSWHGLSRLESSHARQDLGPQLSSAARRAGLQMQSQIEPTLIPRA
jgi:hypothetical protein